MECSLPRALSTRTPLNLNMTDDVRFEIPMCLFLFCMAFDMTLLCETSEKFIIKLHALKQ